SVASGAAGIGADRSTGAGGAASGVRCSAPDVDSGARVAGAAVASSDVCASASIGAASTDAIASARSVSLESTAWLTLRGVEEGPLRATDVSQARPLRLQLIRAHVSRRLPETAEPVGRILNAEEGDHVVLVHAVTRHANRTDERPISIHGCRAGENLQPVGEARN